MRQHLLPVDDADVEGSVVGDFAHFGFVGEKFVSGGHVGILRGWAGRGRRRNGAGGLPGPGRPGDNVADFERDFGFKAGVFFDLPERVKVADESDEDGGGDVRRAVLGDGNLEIQARLRRNPPHDGSRDGLVIDDGDAVAAGIRLPRLFPLPCRAQDAGFDLGGGDFEPAGVNDAGESNPSCSAVRAVRNRNRISGDFGCGDRG